jgi:hypothetical protein
MMIGTFFNLNFVGDEALLSCSRTSHAVGDEHQNYGADFEETTSWYSLMQVELSLH